MSAKMEELQLVFLEAVAATVKLGTQETIVKQQCPVQTDLTVNLVNS